MAHGVGSRFGKTGLLFGVELPPGRSCSSSAKTPAIWRIIFRVGSSLAVRSSPEAVRSRTPRLIRRVMPNSCQFAGKATGVFHDDRPDAVTRSQLSLCLRPGCFLCSRGLEASRLPARFRAFAYP
jgi:hypothetical protein